MPDSSLARLRRRLGELSHRARCWGWRNWRWGPLLLTGLLTACTTPTSADPAEYVASFCSEAYPYIYGWTALLIGIGALVGIGLFALQNVLSKLPIVDQLGGLNKVNGIVSAVVIAVLTLAIGPQLLLMVFSQLWSGWASCTLVGAGG